MPMKGKDPFSLGPVRLQFVTYTHYREHFQLTDYVVKAETHHCQSLTASRRPLRSNAEGGATGSGTIAPRDR